MGAAARSMRSPVGPQCGCRQGLWQVAWSCRGCSHHLLAAWERCQTGLAMASTFCAFSHALLLWNSALQSLQSLAIPGGNWDLPQKKPRANIVDCLVTVCAWHLARLGFCFITILLMLLTTCLLLRAGLKALCA